MKYRLAYISQVNGSPREKVLEEIGVEETFLKVMLVKSIFESKYMYQLHLFSSTLHQER